MNVYLDAMTDLIEARGGFVDKYIGDAILAIFGAPRADPKHATHAVEAALLCQKALDDIEPKLGLPDGRRLRMRIGIHSGPALIGNIGSSRRFNYTAMGDTVNLASRLESANKLYGTDILMSESTASQLSDEFGFHRLERVHVQGRDEPVVLYRPLGFSNQLKAEDHERVSAFEAMWLQLEARNFRITCLIGKSIRQESNKSPSCCPRNSRNEAYFRSRDLCNVRSRSNKRVDVVHFVVLEIGNDDEF
jgi:hypothetical protein